MATVAGYTSLRVDLRNAANAEIAGTGVRLARGVDVVHMVVEADELVVAVLLLKLLQRRTGVRAVAS